MRPFMGMLQASPFQYAFPCICGRSSLYLCFCSICQSKSMSRCLASPKILMNDKTIFLSIRFLVILKMDSVNVFPMNIREYSSSTSLSKQSFSNSILRNPHKSSKRIQASASSSGSESFTFFFK